MAVTDSEQIEDLVEKLDLDRSLAQMIRVALERSWIFKLEGDGVYSYAWLQLHNRGSWEAHFWKDPRMSLWTFLIECRKSLDRIARNVHTIIARPGPRHAALVKRLGFREISSEVYLWESHR